MKKVVYRSKKYTIEQEEMRIRGKKTVIERAIKPDVVVIVAMPDRNTVFLERHFRPQIKKYIWELPAGKIDRKEKPAQAVRRELEEETGFEPRHVEFLFKAYLSPGAVTETAYFFRATGLARSEKSLEEFEDIRVRRFKFGKLLQMIKQNEIMDDKTISGILYCAHFLD